MAKRILLVDDESDFVQLLLYRLQRAGYDVEFAARGMEAINKARLALPDLILLDLLLPDLDGLTLCEILRRQPLTRRIPLVMITAVNSEVARAAASAAGARLMLNKPLDLARFDNTVRELLTEMPAALRPEDQDLNRDWKPIVSFQQ